MRDDSCAPATVRLNLSSNPHVLVRPTARRIAFISGGSRDFKLQPITQTRVHTKWSEKTGTRTPIPTQSSPGPWSPRHLPRFPPMKT